MWDIIERKDTTERELFAETGGLYGFWPSPKKHNVFCVRKNQKKIIYNMTPNTFEFYNLEKDPNEKNNIFNENDIEMLNYKNILFDYFKKFNIEKSPTI